MSYSESESNERYDPEDNLNFYGSPVANSGASTIVLKYAINNAEPSTAEPLARTEFCSCKNSCSIRSGRKRRGCPCRDEGLCCTHECICSTKKVTCKNKAISETQNETRTIPAQSAFERHQIALDEARQQITEFLKTLSASEKDALLLELLANGKGSLDYAKNIVKYRDPNPGYPPTKPPWCTCGVCRPMPSEDENKCCQKVKCVTSFITFQNVCTDCDVLVMAIRSRCDIKAEEPDYSTASFRKAAYRQYILWRYKKLGKGNRRVCPSCIVLKIRQLHPAEDGIYTGFKRA